MSGDPSDLIRAATTLLDNMDHGYVCGPEETKIVVRRLRDALITAQNNFHREAALAEANATIAEREAERDEARKGVEQVRCTRTHSTKP